MDIILAPPNAEPPQGLLNGFVPTEGLRSRRFLVTEHGERPYIQVGVRFGIELDIVRPLIALFGIFLQAGRHHMLEGRRGLWPGRRARG